MWYNFSLFNEDYSSYEIVPLAFLWVLFIQCNTAYCFSMRGIHPIWYKFSLFNADYSGHSAAVLKFPAWNLKIVVNLRTKLLDRMWSFESLVYTISQCTVCMYNLYIHACIFCLLFITSTSKYWTCYIFLMYIYSSPRFTFCLQSSNLFSDAYALYAF